MTIDWIRFAPFSNRLYRTLHKKDASCLGAYVTVSTHIHTKRRVIPVPMGGKEGGRCMMYDGQASMVGYGMECMHACARARPMCG